MTEVLERPKLTARFNLPGERIQNCVILDEDGNDYLVSFFNTTSMTQDQEWIRKIDVILEVEVKNIEYWVLKRDVSGAYFSPARSPSSAPQLYMSKGKAEGRRKCMRNPDEWKVKKWTITETDA